MHATLVHTTQTDSRHLDANLARTSSATSATPCTAIPTTWAEVAVHLAERGTAAVEIQLLSAAAFIQDRNPQLAQLLADESQAGIARCRAFGLAMRGVDPDSIIPAVDFTLLDPVAV